MTPRVVLIASGIIGLLFGAMFMFNADGTIQSFQLGASDVASRLFARAEGSALIGVAIINLIASADRGSRALTAVLAGNLFIHVMGIVIDFTESFPKAGGWWIGLAVHVVFILAFGYLLLKGSKAEAA
jgi:hypothetical protein